MPDTEANKNCQNFQSGQTLIETVIAIFILVSGISAAVGLAIFALSSSQNVTKQIIAVGLAREGIEAVKNMRDTNWLRDTTIDNNCYNPKTGANDAKCYQSWQTQRNFPPAILSFTLGEDLDPPSNPTNHALSMFYEDIFYFDSWFFHRRPHPTSNCDSFSMNFSSNPETWDGLDVLLRGIGQGFYRPRCTGTGNSGFYRQIVLTEDDGVAQYGGGANNPFNKNTGPRLLVISRVWWTDKKCPASASWPGVGKCSVELQTYLTNWKNY